VSAPVQNTPTPPLVSPKNLSTAVSHGAGQGAPTAWSDSAGQEAPPARSHGHARKYARRNVRECRSQSTVARIRKSPPRATHTHTHTAQTVTKSHDPPAPPSRPRHKTRDKAEENTWNRRTQNDLTYCNGHLLSLAARCVCRYPVWPLPARSGCLCASHAKRCVPCCVHEAL
jgi:hypothetical protein